MVIVKVPVKNYQEYEYVLEVIFDNFLKIPFEIEKSGSYDNVEFHLPNGSSLVVKDHFFKEKAPGYSQEMIPSTIKYLESNKYNKFKNIYLLNF